MLATIYLNRPIFGFLLSEEILYLEASLTSLALILR